MFKILFVCTGNVFRSMTAEKCLKDFLLKHNINNIEVDSAGIDPISQSPQPATIERLAFYGIKVSHKYKKINQKLINESDLIISMNFNHQEYIKNNFNIEAPLFNEIAYKKKEGIQDFTECNPYTDNCDGVEEKERIKKHAYYIVDYIYKAIPYLIKNISKLIK